MVDASAGRKYVIAIDDGTFTPNNMETITNTQRLPELQRLFFSLERLVAVRPQIFLSRTIEKLGHMCDRIGRTLEP